MNNEHDTLEITLTRPDSHELAARDETDRYRQTRQELTTAVWSAVTKRDWQYDGRVCRFVRSEANGVPANTRTSLVLVARAAGLDHRGTRARLLAEIERHGWRPDDRIPVLVARPRAVKPAELDITTLPADDGHEAAGDDVDDPLADALVDQLSGDPVPVVRAQDADPVEEPEAVLPADEPEAVLSAGEDQPAPPPAAINLERGQHFSHLFDRDQQIDLIYAAVRAFTASNFRCRYHAVVSGPPGCGKTETLLSLVRMLGPEHCLVLDGPGTTKAGAEQLLTSMDRVPPFLIIEEIEKMAPAHMQWLLGLLDERGEIRRTNARDGHTARDTKVLCLASVNDRRKFQARMHGALASRFAHEVYFPRPTPETLVKIALREIESADGNPAWAEPAVLYCTQVERTTDPRRVRAVALSGRDGLLDNSYQAALASNLDLLRQAEAADRAQHAAETGGRHG